MASKDKQSEINLDDYSSFPHLFPSQKEILQQSIDFFESDLYEQQVLLLNLPTGTGKSAYAEALANYFYQKYGFATNYLCSNKFLQKQMLKDFPNTVKHTFGRNNFQCLVNGNTCNEGKCVLDPNYMCEYRPKPDRDEGTSNPLSYGIISSLINTSRIYELPLKRKDHEIASYYKQFRSNYKKPVPMCPYWVKKIEAINSPIALHNYWYFILENNFIGSFKNRFVLICDEAHKIEDIVLDFVSFSIRQYDIDTLSLPIVLKKQSLNAWKKDLFKVKDYLNSDEYKENIHKYITEQFNDYNSRNEEAIDKEFDRIEKVRSDLLGKLSNLDDINQNDWVFEYESNYKTHEMKSVVFKPVDVDKYVYDLLFYFPMKIVCMSGTLLSKDMFLDTMGSQFRDMDEYDNVKYIDKPSPFPKEHRSIYYKPVANVNYKNMSSSVEKMTPVIRKIFDHHIHEKGIIHTHSYKLANMIKDSVQSDRILTHTKYNRDYVIKTFIESDKPYVLVSPSIEEGVDLKNDLCRFIIMPKIPFLSLKDLRIKKKLKKHKRWYMWKTVQTIIQACGRGVRNMEDYCDTYILDGNIDRILSQGKEFIPQWFRDSIIYYAEFLEDE